jgi:hypothetical protein
MISHVLSFYFYSIEYNVLLKLAKIDYTHYKILGIKNINTSLAT